ncbi:MAG TPA: ATP-binding cassette domain-containing protein [Actinocatenispora sp.]
MTTGSDQAAARGATVRAAGLGLRTRRGWLFRDVTADIGPGELVALAGPSGSGRTSLLLAVAGRFVFDHGTLAVAGHTLPRATPQVQRLAAPAYVTGAHEPEPALTATEHVTERLALLGLPRRRAGLRGRAYARAVLAGSAYDGDPDVLGRDLDPYHRQTLCLALARLARPRLVVVDDVDVGLDTAERAALWAALRAVADTGVTVLASCREPLDAPVDQVLTARATAPEEDA